MNDTRALYEAVASLDSSYANKARTLLTSTDREAVGEQRMKELLASPWASLEDARKLAIEIGRDLHRSEIELLYEHYVDIGWLMGADETAQLLGREVTQEELAKMWRPRLEHNLRADIAIEIAKRLTDKKIRAECLEAVIKFCIGRGWRLEEAQEAATLMGRKLSYRELSALLVYAVASGDLPLVQEITGMMGRDLTQAELLDIFAAASKSGSFQRARDTALLLPEPTRTRCLEEALGSSVEKGDLEWTKHFSRHLGRDLVRGELLKLLTHSFSMHDSHEKTVELPAGRPSRRTRRGHHVVSKERQEIYGEKGRRFCTSVGCVVSQSLSTPA